MSGRNLETMLSFYCLTRLDINFVILNFVRLLSFVYVSICFFLRSFNEQSCLRDGQGCQQTKIEVHDLHS